MQNLTKQIEFAELCKVVHCVDLGESFQIDPNSNEYLISLIAKFGFDTTDNEHLTRTI